MNHYLVLSIYIVGRVIGTVILQAALFLCFQIKQDQNGIAMEASISTPGSANSLSRFLN